MVSGLTFLLPKTDILVILHFFVCLIEARLNKEKMLNGIGNPDQAELSKLFKMMFCVERNRQKLLLQITAKHEMFQIQH